MKPQYTKENLPMQTSAKIALIVVVVLAAGVILLELGIFYVDPTLETHINTATYTPNQNVVINADTFTGNIQIQPTSGSQIEVTYTIKNPTGHLTDVQIKNNETKTDTQTTLVTSAQNSGDPSSTLYSADLLLKLPTSCQYNLTLVTMNGNIVKPQLSCAKLGVSTMNGDITLTDDGAGKIIDATCMNGNINVDLPQNTLFSVVASVGNGNISYQGIQLTASTQSATRLKASTSAGEGALAIQLMTANGNIKLAYT